MQHERVLVLDFGGQYNQLIARRVRDLGVYCDLLPCSMSAEEIEKYAPIGIIFTGGPNSVYDAASPHIDRKILELGIPVLGICYGCQLIAYTLGGRVEHAPESEYGKRYVEFVKESPLSEGIPARSVSWMSHTDYVAEVPAGFDILAVTESCPAAVYGNQEKRIYGVQYHPEVVHSEYGNALLKNFLYNVCHARGDWTMGGFVEEQVKALKEKLAGKKVLCAMSGGVDSAVAATLVHRAVGDNLICVFVDHGLLRLGEAEEVMSVFRDGLGMNLIKADAGELFLAKLAGVEEPEQKRKIIGEEFIRVFEQEAKKIGAVDFLVQGTIYPDVIESGKDSCPPSSTSRRSSSRCATSSRTKCAAWAPSWAFPSPSCSVSPSRGRGSPSVSWAKSPARSWKRCALPTSSSATRSQRRGFRARSGSTLPSSPTARRWACREISALMRTSSPSAPSRAWTP